MSEVKTTEAIGKLPVQASLITYQGDDFYLKVKVDDTAVPIDLTLFTPKAQIRSSPGAADLVATFDITVLDATTLMMHLPSAQSAKVPASAAWDLQITDSAGAVTTLLYGTITAAREVTK